MDEYTWRFYDDHEVWGNGTYNTIDGCIAEARRVLAEHRYFGGNPTPQEIFVGKCVPYIPLVDVYQMLMCLEEQAIDFAGDIGFDWDAYDPIKRNELEELEKTLSVAVIEWLKKYSYYPNLYSVQDIKKFSICEGDGHNDCNN